MKAHIFLSLIFVIFMFQLTSCSRPEMGNGKIRITMPSMSLMSSKSTGSAFIDKLVTKTGDVSMMSIPTLPTAVGDFNCYMVAIGGPGTDLQRNKIWRQDLSQPELRVGDWVGGIPAGGSVEIETSAGPDRVIRLFGLIANPTYCRDFKGAGGYDSSNITNPYLLADVGNITVEAGSSKVVNVTRVFDSAKYYDKFNGPDFDGAGNNGGNGPYVRLEFQTSSGSNNGKYKLTAGSCYQVNAKLFTGQGNTYMNPSATVPVNVTLGTYPFGTFYNVSGCTGGTPTMVSIPISGNVSPPVYFKPSTVGDNLQFNNVTLTSDPVYIAPTWTAAYNMVQIGKPYLKFTGPTRLTYGTNAVCSSIDAHIYNFEGGDYTTHSGTLSFNTANNASLYNIAGSGCTDSASFSFAAYTATASLPFKINALGVYDLGTIVTDGAANFDVLPFVIQSGNGKPNPDALDLDLMGNPVELGKCVQAKLRLVNWDRALAPATGAFDVFVKTMVQGAGMFYSDANCSTATDAIHFAVNDSEKLISFMAYGNGTTMDLYVSAFKYRLYGLAPNVLSVMTVPTPVASDPWFIRMSPPQFSGAKIVGNHEFDESQAYLYIPFSVGSGVTGLDFSPDGGSSWYSIPGGQLIGAAPNYIYKWSTADATVVASRTIRATYNGGSGTRTIRISTPDLYGPNFKFVNCTAVVTTNLSLGVLNTTYASNPVTCLGPATIFNRTAASETYQLVTGYSLIGHSSGSSQISGNGYSGMGLISGPTTSMTSTSAAIANVTLSGILGANAGIYLTGAGSTTSGSTFTISNVATNLLNNQSANYGILIDGLVTGSNLGVFIDRQKAYINGPGSIGLHVKASTSGVKVVGSSYSTQSDQALGIKVDGNAAISSGLTFYGNSFEGNGTGFFGTSNNTSNILNPSILQNGFKITTDYGPGSMNTVGLKLTGRITSSPIISDNVFYSQDTPHRALVEISAISGVAPAPMAINFSGNTLIENAAGGIGFYSDSNTGGTSVSTGDYNSFAFVGASGAGSSALRGDVYLGFSVASVNNIGICSSSSPWGSSISGAGTSGLVSFFSGVTPGVGNVSSNSYRCNDP